MAKVLCVLYDDPVDGYPPAYARDDVPTIERYGDGQSTPSPQAIDFNPGELLGSVSGELGLRRFLDRGRRFARFFAARRRAARFFARRFFTRRFTCAGFTCAGFT